MVQLGILIVGDTNHHNQIRIPNRKTSIPSEEFLRKRKGLFQNHLLLSMGLESPKMLKRHIRLIKKITTHYGVKP